MSTVKVNEIDSVDGIAAVDIVSQGGLTVNGQAIAGSAKTHVTDMAALKALNPNDIADYQLAIVDDFPVGKLTNRFIGGLCCGFSPTFSLTASNVALLEAVEASGANGAFTVSFWFNFTNVTDMDDGEIVPIVAHGTDLTSANMAHAWSLGVKRNGSNFNLYVALDTVTVGNTPGDNFRGSLVVDDLVLGRWYFVVLQYLDPGNGTDQWKIFVDGNGTDYASTTYASSVGWQAASTNTMKTGLPLQVGGSYAGAAHAFSGGVAELAVHGTVLTTSQLQYLTSNDQNFGPQTPKDLSTSLFANEVIGWWEMGNNHRDVEDKGNNTITVYHRHPLAGSRGSMNLIQSQGVPIGNNDGFSPGPANPLQYVNPSGGTSLLFKAIPTMFFWDPNHLGIAKEQSPSTPYGIGIPDQDFTVVSPQAYDWESANVTNSGRWVSTTSLAIWQALSNAAILDGFGYLGAPEIEHLEAFQNEEEYHINPWRGHSNKTFAASTGNGNNFKANQAGTSGGMILPDLATMPDGYSVTIVDKGGNADTDRIDIKTTTANNFITGAWNNDTATSATLINVPFSAITLVVDKELGRWRVASNAITNPRSIAESLGFFTGNLGIGAPAPSAKLEVTVDGAALPNLDTDTLLVCNRSLGSKTSAAAIIASASGASILKLGDVNDEDVGRIHYEHSDDSMRVYTVGVEQVRIDSSGNIGIGNTSPDEKLHIDGSGAKLKVSDETNYDTEVLVYTADSSPGIDLISHGAKASGGISFQDSLHNQEWAIKTNAIVTDGLEFIDGTNTLVMTLEHGGNLGVGNAAPNGKIHVSCSATDGIPALWLEQGDIDEEFIKFEGSSAADGTLSLSENSTEANANKFASIRININGVDKWLRVYDTHE